jgi:hypothetical protein
VVAIRSTLENGLEFERPDFFNESPVSMLSDERARRSGIGFVVRAEVYSRVTTRALREVAEQSVLHDAVFMMAGLRPRVGKQHEDALKSHR